MTTQVCGRPHGMLRAVYVNASTPCNCLSFQVPPSLPPIGRTVMTQVTKTSCEGGSLNIDWGQGFQLNFILLLVVKRLVNFTFLLQPRLTMSISMFLRLVMHRCASLDMMECTSKCKDKREQILYFYHIHLCTQSSSSNTAMLNISRQPPSCRLSVWAPLGKR